MILRTLKTGFFNLMAGLFWFKKRLSGLKGDVRHLTEQKDIVRRIS